MYRRLNIWEDVIRVAKAHGGVNAAKQVAYAWAVHLETEEAEAAKLTMLKKMGLLEYAIEYAAESGDFERALQLTEQSGSIGKLQDIYLKHAMHLEVRCCALGSTLHELLVNILSHTSPSLQSVPKHSIKLASTI
jgi:intraflagellar transport protein 172